MSTMGKKHKKHGKIDSDFSESREDCMLIIILHYSGIQCMTGRRPYYPKGWAIGLIWIFSFIFLAPSG